MVNVLYYNMRLEEKRFVFTNALKRKFKTLIVANNIIIKEVILRRTGGMARPGNGGSNWLSRVFNKKGTNSISSATPSNNNNNNSNNNSNSNTGYVWNTPSVVQAEKTRMLVERFEHKPDSVRYYEHAKQRNTVDTPNYFGHINSPESAYQREFKNVLVGDAKNVSGKRLDVPLTGAHGHPSVLFNKFDSTANLAIQGTTKLPILNTEIIERSSVVNGMISKEVIIPIAEISTSIGFKGKSLINNKTQNVVSTVIVSDDNSMLFNVNNSYTNNLTEKQKEDLFLAIHKAIMETHLEKFVPIVDKKTGEVVFKKAVFKTLLYKEDDGSYTQQTFCQEYF